MFCLSFTTKGLFVDEKDGKVSILQEGAIPKFVDKVESISFSAKRALKNKQRVLYVTERCVFQLMKKGLKLIEVYPGIDKERDVLSQIPFAIKDETEEEK